jgi:ankyrin repeat protein
MLAAREGHLPVFRVLVNKYGCSVRDTRNDGWNALLLAARYGHLHIVRELADKHGANILATKSV